MITQAATGADCKSAVLDFVGASPSSSIMNDEIFRRIFGLLAFLGIVGLWTLLWYLIGFYNAEQLNRRESKENTNG